MLKRIELKNWRSHSSSVVEFERGTNVIIGLMGAGKTSIFQAVLYALFGDLPEIRSRKVSVTGLIRNRPKFAGTAEIKLEFEVEGQLYRVIRRISKEGTDAWLWSGSRLIAQGQRNVTRAIEEILGLSMEEFLNLAYVKQNELDSFLRSTKQGRAQLIDGLLKIDRIEKGLEVLKDVRRGFKLEKEILEKRPPRSEEEIIRELEAARKELEKLQALIKEKEENAEKIKMEFEEIRGRVSELEKSLEELKKKRAALQSLKGKIEILERRISEMPSGDVSEGKLESLKLLEKELEEKIRKIKASKAKEQLYRERIAELKAEKEKLEKILEKPVGDARRRLEDARNKIAGLKAEIRHREEAVKLLEGSSGKCPVCGAPLKNPQTHIQEHRQRISLLREELGKLLKLKTELEIKAAEEERLLREKEIAKERIKEIDEKISRLETLLKQLPAVGEKELEKELEKLRLEIDKSRKILERKRLERELGDAKKRLDELNAEIEGLKGIEEKYNRTIQRRAELAVELRSLSEELRLLRERIEREKILLKRLEEELERAKEYRKRLRRVKAAYELSERLINAMKDLQILVRNTFLQVLNDVLMDTWQEVYPYGDIQAIRLRVETKASRAGDYVLEFKTSAGWQPVDGIASGGERTLAAIALRLALLRLVGKPDFMLLDEPTHNLDEKGIEKLIELLRNASKGLLNQLIVITHEEKLEKAATAYAYRIWRDKGRDAPSEIELLES